MDAESEFNKIGRDPRFVSNLKKRKRPTDEDGTDDRFESLKKQSKSFKDKRGRPWVKNPLEYAKELLQKTGTEEVEDTDEDDQSESENEIDADQSMTDTDEEHSESSSDDEDGGEQNAGLSSNVGNEEFVDIDCESLVKDVPLVERATSRLAVVHFDWDRSKAEDLFLLLESFLPKTGAVKKITVYPSQFGMERMAEEGEQGPRELRTAAAAKPTSDPSNEGEAGAGHDDDDDGKEARRRMREYQISRLKYFYGILELDSAETAAALYEECDGLEYESSGVKLDLRFVADEDTFETPPAWQHLVSTVTSVNRASHVPRKFETSALRSTSLSVTWDETPKERTDWCRRGFEVDDFDREMDEEMLRKYVAFSSEEDDDDNESDLETATPAAAGRKPAPRKLTADQARALLLADDDVGREGGGAGAGEGFMEGPGAIVSSEEESGDDDDDRGKPATAPVKSSSGAAGAGSKEGKKQKRKKRREMMKEKLKKKKAKDEMITELWNEEDNRFDEFLTNPVFHVSSAHPDFKEAKDFLTYIKKRGEVTKSIHSESLDENQEEIIRTKS